MKEKDTGGNVEAGGLEGEGFRISLPERDAATPFKVPRGLIEIGLGQIRSGHGHRGEGLSKLTQETAAATGDIQ